MDSLWQVYPKVRKNGQVSTIEIALPSSRRNAKTKGNLVTASNIEDRLAGCRAQDVVRWGGGVRWWLLGEGGGGQPNECCCHLAREMIFFV